MSRKTILVAEDDAEVREYLAMTLRCGGYDVHLAVDGEEVIRHLSSGRPASLVLLDIMMPNKDGWETLRDIRSMHLDMPVIMLSGMSTPPNVVQAIKSGAADFLAKPVSHEDLGEAIDRVLGEDKAPDTRNVRGDMGEAMYFGNHPALHAIRAALPKVAASDAPVLIQGETGTGKEILARLLHKQSPRAGQEFVKLNCAAVPSELIESELFGYERGAFTGATQRKAGLFELADGGTILLDEIGDMNIHLQAKLLQVLQDQEFRRVGGTDVVRVRVRVVAATHRDLSKAIRDRTFREDLFYRLNVFTLVLPSLRERKEDIVGLAEFLLKRHTPVDTPRIVLTPQLQAALTAFPWPGNIRQLDNIVRQLLVLRDQTFIVNELQAIGEGDQGVVPLYPSAGVPRKGPTSTPGAALKEASRAKHEKEAAAILAALEQSQWNRKRAAALLNIEYKALLYKMKKLSIGERAQKISFPA